MKGCIWLFEQEQALGFSSVSTNIRMTVIKLKSGGLWVHAPIAPTKECIQVLLNFLFLLVFVDTCKDNMAAKRVSFSRIVFISFRCFLNMPFFPSFNGCLSFCGILSPSQSFCLIGWVVNPFCTKNPNTLMLIKVKLSPYISIWSQNTFMLKRFH